MARPKIANPLTLAERQARHREKRIAEAAARLPPAVVVARSERIIRLAHLRKWPAEVAVHIRRQIGHQATLALIAGLVLADDAELDRPEQIDAEAEHHADQCSAN